MIKQAFGKAIADARIEAGITQEQLSSTLNINNRTLQRMEAGENLPTFFTLFRLAEACGITPDQIILPVWKIWLKKGRQKF